MNQAQGRRTRRPRHRFQNTHEMSEARVSFIRRTYSHLMIAIFTCVAMMALFLNAPFFEPVLQGMLSMNWLFVLAIFIGLSWMGDYMARQVQSKPMQYIGLLVGVGAYAVILTPLVLHAHYYAGGGLLVNALALTGLTFAVLTAVVFKTGFDFSILRVGLSVGFVLALGAIVAGVIFGFSLGLGFSVFMVGFSAATVLYFTSEILHTYDTDQHVAASLALFSAIGMLFWYILRIFMAFE